MFTFYKVTITMSESPVVALTAKDKEDQPSSGKSTVNPPSPEIHKEGPDASKQVFRFIHIVITYQPTSTPCTLFARSSSPIAQQDLGLIQDPELHHLP